MCILFFLSDNEACEFFDMSREMKTAVAATAERGWRGLWTVAASVLFFLPSFSALPFLHHQGGNGLEEAGEQMWDIQLF